MRGRIGSTIAAVALSLALAAAPRPAQADDPGLLALGAGIYDFIGDRAKPAGMARVEYRFEQGLFDIKPLAGGFVTNDGTFYGYGGLRADLILADHYVIMPVVTAGVWQRGGGRDLGFPMEVKSGAEFAYRFDSGSRLGVAFEHLSNVGIAERNPGAEAMLAVYSMPIATPF